MCMCMCMCMHMLLCMCMCVEHAEPHDLVARGTALARKISLRHSKPPHRCHPTSALWRCGCRFSAAPSRTRPSPVRSAIDCTLSLTLPYIKRSLSPQEEKAFGPAARRPTCHIPRPRGPIFDALYPPTLLINQTARESIVADAVEQMLLAGAGRPATLGDLARRRAAVSEAVEPCDARAALLKSGPLSYRGLGSGHVSRELRSSLAAAAPAPPASAPEARSSTRAARM